MKLLVYILLFYLAYRFFIRPVLNQVNSGQKDYLKKDEPGKDDPDDGEYIDYEEVS